MKGNQKKSEEMPGNEQTHAHTKEMNKRKKMQNKCTETLGKARKWQEMHANERKCEEHVRKCKGMVKKWQEMHKMTREKLMVIKSKVL